VSMMNNAVIKRFSFLMLGFILLVGCNSDSKLVFELKSNDALIECQQPIFRQQTWQLDQFWFYVSDVKMKVNNSWQQVSLPNNQWQHDNVALLGIHCHESSDKNWQIDLADPALLEQSSAIKFKIAVPFNKNHQNPLKATSIFDNSNMFWTWQQGYKSLRLDLSSPNADAWAFHVGAIGCHSPSALRSPKMQCRQPNHMTITIDSFNPKKPLTIELSHLIKGVELSHDNRCLSMPTQSSCGGLMANLNNVSRPVFTQHNDD